MSSVQEELQLGRLLIVQGIIQPKDLATCLQLQQQLKSQGQSTTLRQVLLDKELVSSIQLDSIQNTANLDETLDSPQKTEIKCIGRYELIEEIGRGGMGCVYIARDKELGRVVALKVLLSENNESDVARFLREAKATAKLRHPNIVPLHDFGNESGQHYFTMDFIPGKSLEEIIDSSTLSPRKIAFIMVKVAKAIHYAHGQGIIHRDLKPANIMVDDNNDPKVMDFGLAKVSEESKKLSMSGAVIGTLYYMPPEQAEGRGSAIDARSDVYSLGAVLYEMLTGRTPFKGKSFTQVLRQVIDKDPTPPSKIKPNIPNGIETICLKAMAKGKKQRYQTALGMAEDLTRFYKGESVKARPPSAATKLKKRVRKNSSTFVILAVSLVIIALLALQLAKKDTPEIDNEQQSTVESWVKIQAQMLNANEKITDKFRSDEKIMVKVGWKAEKESPYIAEKITITGDGIRHHNTFYGQPEKKGKRVFVHTIEITEPGLRHFEINVKVSVGKIHHKQTLNFHVTPAEPVVEITALKLFDEENLNSDTFNIDDRITLEVKWQIKNFSGKFDEQVTVTGKGIRKYNAIYNEEKTVKVRRILCPITVSQPAKEIIDIQVGVIVKKIITHKTIKLNLRLPDKNHTELATENPSRTDEKKTEVKLLRAYITNSSGEKRPRLSYGEKVYIKLRWILALSPTDEKLEIRLYGKNIVRYNQSFPVTKREEKILPLAIKNYQEGAFKVYIKFSVGKLSKKKHREFIIGPKKDTELEIVEANIVDFNNKQILDTIAKGQKIALKLVWNAKYPPPNTFEQIEASGKGIRAIAKTYKGAGDRREVYYPLQINASKTTKLKLKTTVTLGKLQQKKKLTFYYKPQLRYFYDKEHKYSIRYPQALKFKSGKEIKQINAAQMGVQSKKIQALVQNQLSQSDYGMRLQVYFKNKKPGKAIKQPFLALTTQNIVAKKTREYIAKAALPSLNIALNKFQLRKKVNQSLVNGLKLYKIEFTHQTTKKRSIYQIQWYYYRKATSVMYVIDFLVDPKQLSAHYKEALEIVRSLRFDSQE